MVVKKLEPFIESFPSGTIPVNLRELIQRELTEEKGRPTIVLDGSAFYHEHKNCNILGDCTGQPHTFILKIKTFVKKIISSGANLTVFLRGTGSRDKFVWFSKNHTKFREKINTVEELLKQGDVDFNHFALSFEVCCNVTFASISDEHYKVFSSVEGTDKEVANFALKEKPLAVIGQDSNYLIYEGIRYYISNKSLDIETLNCRIYSRDNLLLKLNLNSYQLPMFATLCGNNVVLVHLLKDFHKRISPGKSLNSLMLCLAQRARQTSDDPYGHVRDIVLLIGNPKITASVIKKSLDMYLKFEEIQAVTELEKFAIERTRKCDWSSHLYRIFKYQEKYNKRMTMFHDKSCASFELLRPLRSKLYGILFPFDNVRCVKEYFMEEMFMKGYSKPIPQSVYFDEPTYKHPGLIELFRNRSPIMDILRWNLFLTSVSQSINFSVIRTVPEEMVFPVLALHYLAVTAPSYFSGKKIFNKSDLKAFLTAALLVSYFPLEALEYSEQPVDSWVYQLMTIYMDVCDDLGVLNEACGFVILKKKACICNFYNVTLTKFVYNKMRKGETPEQFLKGDVKLEALFYTLMDVILIT